MKKLLLASMIMIGVSGFAYAQTPDAVKAKKAAAKMDKNQPSLTTTETMATAKIAPVKEKSDAQVAKEGKGTEVKATEVKAVHPNKAKRQN